MSYPLPPRAREIQERVRTFVTEELIPWEVHAEMHDGEVPDDVRKKHKEGARKAGLYNMDIPTEMGGQGLSMLEQAVAQEQLGRVTNALGWCGNNPQSWMLATLHKQEIDKGKQLLPDVPAFPSAQQLQQCQPGSAAGALLAIAGNA